MYRKTFLTLMAVLSAFLLAPVATAPVAHAETAPPLTYAISPVLPENQTEGITSYFSLTSDDEDLEQDLKVLVKNTSDAEHTITIEPVNAYTSANGVIQYATEGMGTSTLLHEDYAMTNHLEVAHDSITLDPNETREVVLHLDANGMEGEVLGGVAFSTLSEAEEVQQGISIKNKVNTVLGVSASFPTEDEGALTTGQATVTPMPSYYTVDLPLDFDVAHIAKDSVMTYAVHTDGQELFTGKQNINFAPKTAVDYAVPFESDTLEEGREYVISGEITYKHSGNVYTVPFSSAFAYTSDSDDPGFQDPKSLGTPDVKPESDSMMLVFGIMGLVILLLLIALIVLWRRGKKTKEEGAEAATPQEVAPTE